MRVAGGKLHLRQVLLMAESFVKSCIILGMGRKIQTFFQASYNKGIL